MPSSARRLSPTIANRALCMKREGRQAARYADGRVSLCHVHLAEPRSPRYAGERAIARAVVIVREVMTMADGHDCASHHEYGPFLPKPAGTFASPLALRGCLCRGAKEAVLPKRAERECCRSMRRKGGAAETCRGGGGVPPRHAATFAVCKESLSAISGSAAVRRRSSVCAVQARHRCFPVNI